MFSKILVNTFLHSCYCKCIANLNNIPGVLFACISSPGAINSLVFILNHNTYSSVLIETDI